MKSKREKEGGGGNRFTVWAEDGDQSASAKKRRDHSSQY
ncbi:uncharacterized protein An09g03390 [Aspergillus niger]|uniref:Contig An09c0090, genomic contig n=2 Tax=Aspergillus niger TaxID=5061 RepID=A2QTV4_ASPNC|nr:uncharacterized protein An09g03390 [Aspergillus niger]CAK40279.1 unnamed protein product [Aspergillus niger]